MPVKRIAAATAAILLHGMSVASASGIELPFALAANDSAETLRIWKGLNDEYLARKDPNLHVFTAKIRTPDGTELTISQMNTPYLCGDLMCPVRILRGEKLVYDESGCRYVENFELTESMNTLFMCDVAVPTKEVPEE